MDTALATAPAQARQTWVPLAVSIGIPLELATVTAFSLRHDRGPVLFIAAARDSRGPSVAGGAARRGARVHRGNRVRGDSGRPGCLAARVLEHFSHRAGATPSPRVRGARRH